MREVRPFRVLRRASKDSRQGAIAFKAVSFALVGVINTVVDASVFFLAYAVLSSRPPAVHFLSSAVDFCGCGGLANATLVTANVFSWFVAITGSYVMNSYTTFAVESGRQLKLRSYGAFLASGILGVVANTTTLVGIAQFAPVWVAKACAILVSFMVNFSMSHFVVFRPRGQPTAP
jgi:putative flippase GtrA